MKFSYAFLKNIHVFLKAMHFTYTYEIAKYIEYWQRALQLSSRYGSNTLEANTRSHHSRLNDKNWKTSVQASYRRPTTWPKFRATPPSRSSGALQKRLRRHSRPRCSGLLSISNDVIHFQFFFWSSFLPSFFVNRRRSHRRTARFDRTPQSWDSAAPSGSLDARVRIVDISLVQR